MQQTFHTQHGEVVFELKSLAEDTEKQPFSRWACTVITPDGTKRTPSVGLGLNESPTQTIAEKVAFSTTTEGAIANRRHNDEIRRYIKSLKNS